MLSSRPGLEEHVLHAILEYECKIQGAQLLAFPPVVASGLSANTLHYISNSHIIRYFLLNKVPVSTLINEDNVQFSGQDL